MAEMKDSGIEWISDIPEDWDVIRCKYISTFLNGYAFDSKDLQMDFMYPVIRIGDIKNGEIDNINCQGVNNNYGIENYLIKENDILLAMSGATVGKVGIAHNIENAYINQRVGIIRTDYPSYLFYCLSTKEFIEYILLSANGSAQPNVSADVYREFGIPFPPKEIKIKIVDFLDEKCAEIDTLHSDIEKQIDTLEEYKKSIITETVTKGLDPDVEMKDSGIEWIGMIPKEWECKKIKYVTNLSRGIFGHRPRNDPRYYDGKYPFIQTGDVACATKVITNYSQTLNELGKKVSKEFKKGTIALTIAANVGDVSILGFNAYFPDSIMAVIPHKEIDNMYFYYILSIMKSEFLRVAIINTQLNLNVERVGNLYIPITFDKNKQKEIVKYLDEKRAEIDGAIEEKKEQLETLEQYKKSLIYEYVTGKKEVK